MRNVTLHDTWLFFLHSARSVRAVCKSAVNDQVQPRLPEVTPTNWRAKNSISILPSEGSERQKCPKYHRVFFLKLVRVSNPIGNDDKLPEFLRTKGKSDSGCSGSSVPPPPSPSFTLTLQDDLAWPPNSPAIWRTMIFDIQIACHKSRPQLLYIPAM